MQLSKVGKFHTWKDQKVEGNYFVLLFQGWEQIKNTLRNYPIFKAKFARKAHLIRHIESVHEEKNSPVVQKDVILFKSDAVTSVQLKQGFGIGNRNQSPISISLAVTQKERKQDLQPYEAARNFAGPKNSTTKSHVIEGKDKSYWINICLLKDKQLHIVLYVGSNF